jgi:hypothetical protein
MATSSTRRYPPQQYTGLVNVRLDATTHAKLEAFIAAFHRSQSEVLRYLLAWGLRHRRGEVIEAPRPRAPLASISLRAEPELLMQVRVAAQTAGCAVSAWLRRSSIRRRRQISRPVGKLARPIPRGPVGGGPMTRASTASGSCCGWMTRPDSAWRG